mgnify:CR=1 FL=1
MLNGKFSVVPSCSACNMYRNIADKLVDTLLHVGCFDRYHSYFRTVSSQQTEPRPHSIDSSNWDRPSMHMLYILHLYMVFTFKFKPRMVLVSYHDKILMMYSTGGRRIEILISDILFTDWTSMLPVSWYIYAYNLIYIFTFPVRISSIFIPWKIIVPKQSTYYISITILSIFYSIIAKP